MFKLTRNNATWNPWREFESIHSEIDKALAQFQRPNFRSARRVVGPKANFWRSETGFVLALEIPGLKLDDLEVTVNADSIDIEALQTHRMDGEGDQAVSHVRRRFTLPESVEPNRTEACYKNGILTLRLYRPERLLPHKVELSKN